MSVKGGEGSNRHEICWRVLFVSSFLGFQDQITGPLLCGSTCNQRHHCQLFFANVPVGTHKQVGKP